MVILLAGWVDSVENEVHPNKSLLYTGRVICSGQPEAFLSALTVPLAHLKCTCSAKQATLLIYTSHLEPAKYTAA